MLSRWRELLKPSVPAGAPAPPPPVWHGIRLRRTLSLAAKEKFKIVVVLREPPTHTDTERTKGVDGPTGHRRIRDERTVRRARWPLVTGGIGVLLAGVLLAANLVPEAAGTKDPSVECVRGDLDVIGSSAFAPIMTTVANRYDKACDGATVRVTATGSIAGVRQLAGNLTSDSCETTDRVPGAPVIHCERETEAQLIDEVVSTPGAIGYVPRRRRARSWPRSSTTSAVRRRVRP